MIDYCFLLQTMSVFNISAGASGFSVYLSVIEEPSALNFKVPTTLLLLFIEKL